MPTPIGHALAGLSLAWFLRAAAGPAPGADRPPAGLQTSIRAAAACIVFAAAPDLDILFGSHRTMSHSLGGTAIAGAAAALIAPRFGVPAWRAGLACGAAWGSHVLLDWLGKDSRAPHGIMALWPISHEYFSSGLDLFAEVSRRWWIPEQFIFGNLQSVARELAILGPVALAAWQLARRRQ